MSTAAPEPYLTRLLALGTYDLEQDAPTLEQYTAQLQAIAPAEVIEVCDTAAQVLFLLTLDTERRDQLGRIASGHNWPAPAAQPWDGYVRHAALAAA